MARRRFSRLRRMKNRIVRTLKTNKNVFPGFMEHYILNRMVDDGITNDRGASFTDINRKSGVITKRATPSGRGKLMDEIRWMHRYENTPIGKHIPRIISSCMGKRKVWVTMKYYEMPNLRSIILNRTNAVFFISRRLQSILNALKKNVYTEAESIPVPADFVIKAHLDKFDSRITKALHMEPSLKTIMENAVTINDAPMIPAKKILDWVRGNKDTIRSLTPPRLYRIHGDLHTNNILCGVLTDSFILLDPRGRSPYGTEHCDIAYDIAKLYHDFRSYYSLIEKHRYSLFIETRNANTLVHFRFLDNESAALFDELFLKLRKQLRSTFPKRRFGDWELRAEFIEALLFLTMVPFHLKDRSEGFACYLSGLIDLNAWMRRYHPKEYRELLRKM